MSLYVLDTDRPADHLNRILGVSPSGHTLSL